MLHVPLNGVTSFLTWYGFWPYIQLNPNFPVHLWFMSHFSTWCPDLNGIHYNYRQIKLEENEVTDDLASNRKMHMTPWKIWQFSSTLHDPFFNAARIKEYHWLHIYLLSITIVHFDVIDHTDCESVDHNWLHTDLSHSWSRFGSSPSWLWGLLLPIQHTCPNHLRMF